MLKPQVHEFAKASAIIHTKSGFFSHAALTFSDLAIPTVFSLRVTHLTQMVDISTEAKALGVETKYEIPTILRKVL